MQRKSPSRAEESIRSTILHAGDTMLIEFDLTWFIVFNATFSNISAIAWQPVLVVEEARVQVRTTDHGQATGKLDHLRMRVECTLFCNLQSRAQTHAVLVIGLYELLGNPTT